MGVIRVEHTKDYTTMSNHHLRNPELSLRAMGLMSKMLALPDDWDYTVAGLAAICKEGRDAVRKALQELEAAGYLVRSQTRSSGTFSSNDYTLFETPPLTENPSTVNPSTEKPLTVKPSTGKPLTEKPTQLNNVINQKTKRQKPPAPAWEPEAFERFWKAYPRGDDKASARREWDLLKPDRELIATMSAALERAKNTDEWRRGIGIPYACRWIKNRRWEDRLKEDRPAAPADAEASGRRDMPWL
jgi:hypothetical protein